MAQSLLRIAGIPQTPPQTLMTPGHTLRYSQPTRNKEFPPQIPDLKLQPLKSAGGASQRAGRGFCIPRCQFHTGVRRSHLWGLSGFTAVPQGQRLPDWTDFSHSVTSKRVWTQQPPSLRSHGEREKFMAVCFGSGVFLVQHELLCPKIPWRGAHLSQQSPRSSSQRADGNINALSASDFPAKIQNPTGISGKSNIALGSPPNKASWPRSVLMSRDICHQMSSCHSAPQLEVLKFNSLKNGPLDNNSSLPNSHTVLLCRMMVQKMFHAGGFSHSRLLHGSG